MDARSFAEFLVDEGAMQRDRINAVLERVAVTGDRVDTVVLALGLAPEEVVLSALGRLTRSRTASGSDLRAASRELTALIPSRLARRFGVIPFRREGRTLHVAALEPGDLLVQDELGILTGSMITTYAALEIRIKEALARYYRVPPSPRIENLLRKLAGTASGRHALPERPRPSPPPKQPETRPVESPAPVRAETPPPEPSPPRRTAPSELELSPEERELFPSLFEESGPADLDAAESREAETALPDHAPKPQPAEEPVPEDPGTAEELDIEARLAHASEALQSAEIRDDIADALLEFCTPYLDRCMLLTLRGDTIVGWRGLGAGVDESVVRAIAIPRSEPSVFSLLLQGTAFWLGPLPPMPRNQEVTMTLGDPPPAACLVLPIKVKGKIVAFLYGDRGDKPLGALPIPEFKRLIAKTDVAFQVYLLKGKIRVM